MTAIKRQSNTASKNDSKRHETSAMRNILFVLSLVVLSSQANDANGQSPENSPAEVVVTAQVPKKIKKGPPLPQVQVSRVRRVFHNGEHNSFTDLTRFRGRYYLTFRSCPDGHMVHPTSSIIVLVSDDLNSWTEVNRFQVKRRDVRDPHFLVFQEKLFVYAGTWFCGNLADASKNRDLNLHVGYGVSSEDGQSWTDPVLLEGTFGHYIWRAASFDNTAYLCGRRKKGFDVVPRKDAVIESVMLESTDGLVFKTGGMFQAEHGDETAFQFSDDGSVLAIGRRGRDKAQVLRSAPPYEKWQRDDLDRYIGGPLLSRWGNRIVVAGRNNTDSGPKTKFCWLIGNDLHEFATLPSGGDNSYPGFVELSPSKAAVSWYSSHETDKNGQAITAIYMAEFTMSDNK